jgi:Na+-translocating ferredoxin:NAD+ oxidoreductase subunit C
LQPKSFHGGIHPPEEKEFTEHLAIERLPAPKEIVLPLTQHLGKPALALVQKGSEVKTGMLVAEPQGFISAPIHSPVTGKVTALTRQLTSGGYPQPAIVIAPNLEEDVREFMPPLDPETITPEEIIERVRAGGLVGQGGAAFPTAVKLSPPPDKPVDLVILNGCECEPYLTRDYRLMVERPQDVVAGLKLIMKAMKVEQGMIGIEDNKPEAIRLISEAAAHDPRITIQVLRTKYPQGAEKMLIQAAAGRKIAPGKLPFDAGVAIQNVGTAVAVYDVVVKGEPHITADLTVTGRGIRNPKNLLVPVGTPLEYVLEYCGGVTDDAVRLIVGGPMMGVAQYDFSAPIMKATSGIVVLTREEVEMNTETACLNCGKCVEACPVNLVPTKLVKLIRAGRFEDAAAMQVSVCMECGTCAYLCPANIPLVQWLRLGKQKAMRK